MIKGRKGSHREIENEKDERKKGVKKKRKAETFHLWKVNPSVLMTYYYSGTLAHLSTLVREESSCSR